MSLILTTDEVNTFKRKLRSIELFLSAHPQNEEHSEMRDRLDDVEEMISLINKNQHEQR